MADRIEHTSPSTTKVKARGGKAILSKGRLLITTSIVILIMAYAVLGMGYLKELKEQGKLSSQIAEVNQTISEIPQPAEDLEQQLTEAQTLLTAEQNSFPAEINTTQLVNTILGLANSCGVDATPMATKPWAVEMVGKHSYPVLRLTIAVEGSLPALTNFAHELENGEYTTLIIEDLTAERGSEQSEEGVIPIVGSLKLAIYARSLSPE
jgi:Tfp pilus assembly protein PilO